MNLMVQGVLLHGGILSQNIKNFLFCWPFQFCFNVEWNLALKLNGSFTFQVLLVTVHGGEEAKEKEARDSQEKDNGAIQHYHKD